MNQVFWTIVARSDLHRDSHFLLLLGFLGLYNLNIDYHTVFNRCSKRRVYNLMIKFQKFPFNVSQPVLFFINISL